MCAFCYLRIILYIYWEKLLHYLLALNNKTNKKGLIVFIKIVFLEIWVLSILYSEHNHIEYGLLEWCWFSRMRSREMILNFYASLSKIRKKVSHTKNKTRRLWITLFVFENNMLSVQEEEMVFLHCLNLMYLSVLGSRAFLEGAGAVN